MNKENIQMLLETICQYNTVRITQIFAKDDTEWIRVKCIPDTHMLEMTYLQTETVECYESVKEAVEVISKSFHPSITF
ncbi:hypothetical protein [Planococcus soli]|uniref:hypothetical protein n=1 Tax=Planococcus soli TaxID=2666072 RepID=UPI00115CF27C|nr:hypothetical protein [Planococcus soli]